MEFEWTCRFVLLTLQGYIPSIDGTGFYLANNSRWAEAVLVLERRRIRRKRVLANVGPG